MIAPLARRLWLARAAALGVGALQTFAFAPFGYWPLAIVCPAFLMWQWREARPREAAALRSCSRLR